MLDCSAQVAQIAQVVFIGSLHDMVKSSPTAVGLLDCFRNHGTVVLRLSLTDYDSHGGDYDKVENTTS